MLSVTEKAAEHLKGTLAGGEYSSGRLRVYIDHRCHCGMAHFSLALERDVSPEDMLFEVRGIPFVADVGAVPELPSVEIDYVETVWTKGFTIQNIDHQCGTHMMD